MCDAILISAGKKTWSVRSRREYHASFLGLWPLSVSLAFTTKRLTFHSSLDFSLAVASPAFLLFGDYLDFSLVATNHKKVAIMHVTRLQQQAMIYAHVLATKIRPQKIFIIGTTPEITKF